LFIHVDRFEIGYVLDESSTYPNYSKEKQVYSGHPSTSCQKYYQQQSLENNNYQHQPEVYRQTNSANLLSYYENPGITTESCKNTEFF